MRVYIAKRLGRGIITLIGISIVVFFLTHVLGDPAAMMIPSDASNQLLENTRHSLGLDAPLPHQFKEFVIHGVKGDFGPSMFQGTSSRELILRSIPPTALLAGTAFALSAVFGLLLGVLAAWKPRTWLDKIVSVLSIAFISIPEFWFALLAIIFVAVRLHALPTSGYGHFDNLIMPAIVLSLRPTGRIAQITRSAMLDVTREPYATTAYAKGLPTRLVVWRHLLKNASIPIVTMSGLEVADLLSGAIIVETIFAWPGIGWLTGTVMIQMDFPVIETIVIWAAVITVCINLLVDLSYAWLNPRVTHR